MNLIDRHPHYQLGLVGYPILHSLSPLLHEHMLRMAGLQGSYTCLRIDPDGDVPQSLNRLAQDLREERLHGLNVTIPYKRSFHPFIDVFNPTAQATGAVNTLHMQEGRLTGDNTDVEGFSRDLARLGFQTPPAAGLALVLGAGGAARAAVYALHRLGWQVNVAARRPDEARRLAVAIGSAENPIQALSLLEQETFRIHPCHLIVNTTPLGMLPHETLSAWPAGIALPKEALVYDMVYQQDTPLLMAARSAGHLVSGGLGMLIEQAALSFEIWTGCKVDSQELWKVLEIVE
jgi:shikimate dehydrogenase